MSSITVNGMRVEIVRKAIKNLHLGVYPPQGRVRVAAPMTVSDDAVRLAVITRLPWIKRQQANFSSQERQSARQYVSGETHYVFGSRRRLSVKEEQGVQKVSVENTRALTLQVRPGADRTQRESVLLAWYRKELRSAARPLVEKWATLMRVPVPQWGIKRMKTKWGSCSIASKRIWLNLELAKKPTQCLEYVIVHELAHLLERHHNTRFIKHMDRHLPQWRLIRDELNFMPLKDEDWRH